MSNYWSLFCHDCFEPGERGPGNQWNHVEERLTKILVELPKLALMPSIDVDRGDLGEFIDFARKHHTHNVTVRKYGYDYGQCTRYPSCLMCGHRLRCELKDMHEGSCAPGFSLGGVSAAIVIDGGPWQRFKVGEQEFVVCNVRELGKVVSTIAAEKTP